MILTDTGIEFVNGTAAQLAHSEFIAQIFTEAYAEDQPVFKRRGWFANSKLGSTLWTRFNAGITDSDIPSIKQEIKRATNSGDVEISLNQGRLLFVVNGVAI